MIAVVESSRSVDREPLEWCVDVDIYESFCAVFGPGGLEKYRHIEQAMREFADLDDHAEAENELGDLLDSLSVSKEKNRESPEFSMRETYKIRLSVNADLKAAFKQFTHELLGSKSYGYALTRALREYLLNPRARRLTEKIDRLGAALQDGDLRLDLDPDAGDVAPETEPDAAPDGDGEMGGRDALPDDVADRLEEAADRRDESVGSTVRDRAAEMGSTLLERRDRDEVVDEMDLAIVVADHPSITGKPSTPTRRRYQELLLAALDLQRHPKHHEKHADRFPDGETDPDVTEYLFPHGFREVMQQIHDAREDVDADRRSNDAPDQEHSSDEAADVLAALQDAEAVTSSAEDSVAADVDDRRQAMTDGGERVNDRPPGSATATGGDPPPDQADGCG